MREDEPDFAIDLDVHDLVQQVGAEPTASGRVSGDEQAILKERGIV